MAGVPAERAEVAPEVAWALRGDRGLTYAAEMPAGTRLVAGRWWDGVPAGPPQVSLDARLAEGFGIGVGDGLTLNVLGRDVEVVVASLREIDWRSAGTNFTLVASPGVFDAAPHGLIGTIRAPPEAEGPFLEALARELPNVSAVPVREALAAVAALAARLEAALSAVAGLALAAGLLVVAAATAASREARLRDVVVLRALGVGAPALRRAALAEFAAVGLAAGLLAALVGAGASWAVAEGLLGARWTPAPWALLGTVAAGIAAAAAAGWAGTASVLRASPAAALRRSP